MTTAADIENILAAALPEKLRGHAAVLAQVIDETARGVLLPEAARMRLADPSLVPVLAALAEQTIEADVATLQFGSIVVAGNVSTIKQITITGSTIHGSVIDTQINIHLPPTPRAVDPVAAQALLDAFPLDTIPDLAPLPLGSRMPFTRNPLFVGREADLRKLAAVLKGGGTAAIGQVAAATGLGGIGKTQLATEFIHRYGQYFAGGVFWLSFAKSAGAPAEIAVCGRPGYMELHPDYNALKLDEQVLLVQAAWQQPIPRLLVFDNCEDEALLAQWRPTSGGCRVLITSRRAQWDLVLGVAALALDVLPRTGSIALLRKFRPDLTEDDPHLDAIAAELSDLPLALHLVGNFLARYRHAVMPAAYLEQLRSPALLQHHSLQSGGISPTGHIQHVERTFALSYERLDSAAPIGVLAITLLARAAYLALGEPIPRELLVATLGLPDDQNSATLPTEDALGRLVELGLLEEGMDGALRMHRLVAAFVRETVADEGAQGAVEWAILEVDRRMRVVGDPLPLLALQAHLRAITDRAIQREDDQAARLCSELDQHLALVGDYSGAQHYAERALAIRERILGSEHLDTVWSLNSLAMILYRQGNYTTARPLYERALAIREQVLGLFDPDTALISNNLAALLYTQGDYTAARPLYERALAIREQTLGPSHRSTALSLSNLALLHVSLGDSITARSLLERAVAIWEQETPIHPDIAFGLTNLAELLREQGDYTAARLLYERALAIREQMLGPSHHRTALSLNNLARLLKDQGNYAAARPLVDRALTICEHTLGSEHPDTAQSLANLAALFYAQGEHVAARPLYERALVIYTSRFGPDHPLTRTVHTALTALDRPPQTHAP